VSVVGIFLLCGGMYFTVLAEQYIPSSLSALIVAVIPLWVAAAEGVLPGMDRPTARGIAGLFLGFAGLGLLMWPRITGIHGSGVEWIGVGLQITGHVALDDRLAHLETPPGEGPRDGCHRLRDARRRGRAARCSASSRARCPACRDLGRRRVGTRIPRHLRIVHRVHGVRLAAATVPTSKVMTYTYVNPVVAVFLGWAAGPSAHRHSRAGRRVGDRRHDRSSWSASRSPPRRPHVRRR
jgi:hypothetical protein